MRWGASGTDLAARSREEQDEGQGSQAGVIQRRRCSSVDCPEVSKDREYASGCWGWGEWAWLSGVWSSLLGGSGDVLKCGDGRAAHTLSVHFSGPALCV